MEYKQEDLILETTLINLYTISKRSGVIRLKEFDRKNKAHLCLFNVAKICSNLHNFPIEVNCSWLQFMLLKGKTKSVRRMKLIHFLDKSCDELINDIEEAYDAPGAFVKIYETYYRGRE